MPQLPSSSPLFLGNWYPSIKSMFLDLRKTLSTPKLFPFHANTHLPRAPSKLFDPPSTKLLLQCSSTSRGGHGIGADIRNISLHTRNRHRDALTLAIQCLKDPVEAEPSLPVNKYHALPKDLGPVTTGTAIADKGLMHTKFLTSSCRGRDGGGDCSSGLGSGTGGIGGDGDWGTGGGNGDVGGGGGEMEGWEWPFNNIIYGAAKHLFHMIRNLSGAEPEERVLLATAECILQKMVPMFKNVLAANASPAFFLFLAFAAAIQVVMMAAISGLGLELAFEIARACLIGMCVVVLLVVLSVYLVYYFWRNHFG